MSIYMSMIGVGIYKMTCIQKEREREKKMHNMFIEPTLDHTAEQEKHTHDDENLAIEHLLRDVFSICCLT